MRESKTFGKRTPALHDAEVKRKYFLVCEGTDTELIYFSALIALKHKVGIHPLIELVPLLRSYGERGWSHPQKLIDMILENSEQKRLSQASYENIINWIMDYFVEEEYFSLPSTKESFFASLKWVCEKKLNVLLDEKTENIYNVLEQIMRELEALNKVEVHSANIEDIIELGTWTYDAEIDKICFIVDRDSRSFSSEQYAKVTQRCADCGYIFCVTNPCFEFWLLMHFDDVNKISTDEMKDNNLVTGGRRYAEDELRRCFPEYKKTKYPAGKLVDRLDIAIKNEKMFCENEVELENHIGSNIGVFIDSIREHY